jgi:hypothetical protein
VSTKRGARSHASAASKTDAQSIEAVKTKAKRKMPESDVTPVPEPALGPRPTAKSVARLQQQYEARRDSAEMFLADGTEDEVALFSLAVQEAQAWMDYLAPQPQKKNNNGPQQVAIVEAALIALRRVLAGNRLADPRTVLSMGWTEERAWRWAVDALESLLAQAASLDGSRVAPLLPHAWLVFAGATQEQRALKVYPDATGSATGVTAAQCGTLALALVLEAGEYQYLPIVCEHLTRAATSKSVDELLRAECAETLARIYLGSSEPEQAALWATMSVQLERKLGRRAKLVESLAMLSECYVRCRQVDNARSVATERVAVAAALLAENTEDEFAQVRAQEAAAALEDLEQMRKPRRRKR